MGYFFEKVFFFFTLLLLVIFSKEMIGVQHDNQVWLYLFYERPLVTPWHFHFLAEGRWRDGGAWLNQKIIEAEVVYPFNKWFAVAPGYRNDWITFVTLPHVYNQFHIPYVDFYLHLTKGKERIKNRLRPEYVIQEKGRNFWLIRDRITWFLPPIQPKKMNLTPYLQEEVFWRDLDGIFENRIYVGATLPLKGHFKGGIFFLHRVLRGELGWEHDKVLGLQLHYIID